MAFCPEHRMRDLNLKFKALSETTSIPAPCMWESPPAPGLNEANAFLMKLNAKKCKEPRVCFLKQPPGTPPRPLLYELIDKYSKKFVRTRL